MSKVHCTLLANQKRVRELTILIAHNAIHASELFCLGFHQSVIKTKNRNHSMNKVKNLGYVTRLIYKQPRQ